jgi:hypothetical protein
MDDTPTCAVDACCRVAAALTNRELANVLDVLFRRFAAAEGEMVVLLDERSRRAATLSSTPPT